MRLIAVLTLIMIFSSCQNRIEITTEYILNEYWDPKFKTGNNSLKIEKLIVKNDSLYYVLEKYPHSQLFYLHLEIDTLFCYSAYLGTENINTVYFNKEYNWKWRNCSNVHGGIYETSKIGNLENNEWYRFSNLKMNSKYYLYVYIDNDGVARKHTVNLANF